MAVNLHTKYRPMELGEMYGQDHIVKAFDEFKKSKSYPHALLLVGNAGSGKTTTARLFASMVGCSPERVLEIDAASNTGVDDMRNVLSSLKYKGFGKDPIKLIVLDEIHRLSKNAFDALLKTLEEPPEHVYFALCTTELGKVPKTIQTRCVSFNFKPLKKNDLIDLILDVASAEEMTNIDEKIANTIALSSDGSPRQALVNLAKVSSAENLGDVAELLEMPGESKEAIDFCRMITTGNGFNWKSANALLNNIDIDNAEGLRLMIVNYCNSMLARSTTEEKALPLLNVLNAFKNPCHPSEKLAPIYLAIGDLLFGE